jgi:hypothetical protein
MVCYLEAIDLGVWRVTRDGMKPPKYPEKLTTSDEKEIHLNARAKKCLYGLKENFQSSFYIKNC